MRHEVPANTRRLNFTPDTINLTPRRMQVQLLRKEVHPLRSSHTRLTQADDASGLSRSRWPHGPSPLMSDNHSDATKREQATRSRIRSGAHPGNIVVQGISNVNRRRDYSHRHASMAHRPRDTARFLLRNGYVSCDTVAISAPEAEVVVSPF